MVKQPEGQWVVPNPRIPRSFGLMNIIFGSLMLLIGAGYAAIYAFSPMFTQQMQAGIKKQQEVQKAAHESKLAALKQKEDDAETEEAKEMIRDERATLEKNVEPDLSGMDDLLGWNIFSDVRLAIYYFSEVASGMLLNLLMIIAGVGLMACGMGATARARGGLAEDPALGCDDCRVDGPDPADDGRKNAEDVHPARGPGKSSSGRSSDGCSDVSDGTNDGHFRRRRDGLHRCGGLGVPGALALVPDSPPCPRRLLERNAIERAAASKRIGRRVVNLATVLLGPLVGPECRRALARGWLVVLRALVGSLLALIVLFLIWVWSLDALVEPYFIPRLADLRTVLAASAMILLTIAVVQAPAVLAGSLAGERERGVLQLLLTTAVSPREIVLGRLLGKLSQVGMILLAGLPPLALLAAWNGYGLLHLATIALLLAAVSLGGGGLGVGASVVSRRGRDALLTVYILMLIVTLSPLLWRLGLPLTFAERLESFNPYLSAIGLVWSGEVIPALATSVVWLLCGLAGCAAAAWRLRPSCLALTGTGPTARRRGWVPPMEERPMLWKELHVERVGTLGKFGRWVGVLITGSIGLGSLVLAGIIVWSLCVKPAADWNSWAINLLALVLGGFAGNALGCVLQWGVGLARRSRSRRNESGARGTLFSSARSSPLRSPARSSTAAFMPCAGWPARCSSPGRWEWFWEPFRSAHMSLGLPATQSPVHSWPRSGCAVRSRCPRRRKP